MGQLAQLAGASKLRGAVVVNMGDGTVRTFPNEVEAEAACQGLKLRHERGSFFVVEQEDAKPATKPPPKKAKKKPEPKADEPEPEGEKDEEKPSSGL